MRTSTRLRFLGYLGALTLGLLGIKALGDSSSDLRIFPDEYLPNIQADASYEKWSRGKRSEIRTWENFRDAVLAGWQPTPPTMPSDYGRALVAAGAMHMNIARLVG